MTATAHHDPDCLTCAWWYALVAESMERALAGCAGAQDREKRARVQLAEHVKRSHPARAEVSPCS